MVACVIGRCLRRRVGKRAGGSGVGRLHWDFIVLERVPRLLLTHGRDADDASLAGQHRQTRGEVLVHLTRHLATLRDGPHDQRLAATAV